MPFGYYIGNNGTCGNDDGRVDMATSLRTGAFTGTASDKYESVADAIASATTPPAAGDFFLCDNADTFVPSPVGDQTWAIPDGSIVMSVDHDNQENYAQGYKLDLSSAPGGDLIITQVANGWGALVGVNLKLAFQLAISGNVDGYSFFLIDCDWEKSNDAGTFADFGSTGVNGQVVVMRNVELNGISAGDAMSLVGTRLIADKISAHASHTKMTHFATLGFGVGMSACEIYNSDLDALVAASTEIVELASNHNAAEVIIERCKMAATQVPMEDPTQGPDSYRAHSIDAADDTETIHEGNFFGEHITDTGVTRDHSFSLEVTTTAEASRANPYRVKIGTFPKKALSTAQTVTANFTSADSGLTISEVWIEAVHNDNNDEVMGVPINSSGAKVYAPDDTAHATSGSGWTGSLGTDYVETLDIPAQSNVDDSTGQVDVYLCVSQASLTLNVDLATIADT